MPTHGICNAAAKCSIPESTATNKLLAAIAAAVSSREKRLISDTAPGISGNRLVEETNALVDSFAQVLERSLTLYQGRIKPEEVKALLISAYIQRQKLSSAA